MTDHPETLRVVDADGITIVVHRWTVDEPRAVVQILHGWAEHSRRYDHVAAALNDAGYSVYADDHRGHGLTGTEAGGLGDLGPRGMSGVLDAVHTVTELIRREESGSLPLFLLGHSWGSFLGQQYIRTWGGELAGVLLTGTTLRTEGSGGRRTAAAGTAPAASPLERYAWLTRDTAEVQRYVDDPMCGFERMRAGTSPATATRDDAPLGQVPVGLPILVFNGADDRIGGAEGGKALVEHYRQEGIADVTLLTYEGARHELFNETNRVEVITDVLAWLEARAQC